MACRRIAIRRGYYSTARRCKAQKAQGNACGTFKPLAVSSLGDSHAICFIPAEDALRVVLGWLEKLLQSQRGNSPRFIPQGEFDPVPKPELVVNHPQIIFNDMFRRPDVIRNFFVLKAFGNKLDDSVFTFIWDTVSITSICRHACLRYKRVASFTRLIPPVIPKRRNKRLK